MATAAELRSLIHRLSNEAGAELAAIWGQVFTADLTVELDHVVDVGGSLKTWLEPTSAKLYSALMDTLPALVGDYGDAASVVAAEWYDEYRSGLGIDGSYQADVATVDLGAEALAGWGSSLVTPQLIDWDAALVRLTGGLQRRIATAGRETITGATYADPQALGWQRQARSDGCGFCQMLAGRATLYKSATTADFGAHDHCNCLAIPAFGGRPTPVRAYRPTGRNITDADRARTREWINANF